MRCAARRHRGAAWLTCAGGRRGGDTEVVFELTLWSGRRRAGSGAPLPRHHQLGTSSVGGGRPSPSGRGASASGAASPPASPWARSIAHRRGIGVFAMMGRRRPGSHRSGHRPGGQLLQPGVFGGRPPAWALEVDPSRRVPTTARSRPRTTHVPLRVCGTSRARPPCGAGPAHAHPAAGIFCLYVAFYSLGASLEQLRVDPHRPSGCASTSTSRWRVHRRRRCFIWSQRRADDGRGRERRGRHDVGRRPPAGPPPARWPPRAARDARVPRTSAGRRRGTAVRRAGGDDR